VFRVKIALLSASLSGLVLVGCGMYFLTVISAINLDRIDREINALGESQLHVWHSKKHWEDFEGSLRSIYGPEKWKNLMVSVTDADHQVLYRSPHWLSEITLAAFPDFDREMEKGPRPGPSAGDGQPPEPGRPPRAAPEPGYRSLRDVRPPPAAGGREREGRPAEFIPPDAAVRIKTPEFRTFSGSAGAWRTGIMGNQHVTIVLGVNLSGYYSDADRFKKAFVLFLPAALVILAAGGWLIAQRALKPVAAITNTAQRITARGLDQRVPEGKADSELLTLIRTINTMLDRLERSFNQAVRFSADAAHELQTPLTVLQGMLDEAVRQSPRGDEEQRRYASLLEEVQRLKPLCKSC
jgi:HAMP domain-containing protein